MSPNPADVLQQFNRVAPTRIVPAGRHGASCPLLEDLVPGSFAGLEGYQGHALSWRLVYFSFVTLTTLGYGDVLPLTVYGETLILLEAVLGQFYLAVLVAGLIGAYLSDREIPKETETGKQSGGSSDTDWPP